MMPNNKKGFELNSLTDPVCQPGAHVSTTDFFAPIMLGVYEWPLQLPAVPLGPVAVLPRRSFLDGRARSQAHVSREFGPRWLASFAPGLVLRPWPGSIAYQARNCSRTTGCCFVSSLGEKLNFAAIHGSG